MREAATVVASALDDLRMPVYAKTSGSRGIHLYVPIVRGPVQHDVWRFAKAFALAIAAKRADILTAEYKIAKRPKGRVLVDYNQNAWGRTLASVYSVRPTPLATVSTPLDWDEIGGRRRRSTISGSTTYANASRARAISGGRCWWARTKRVDLTPYL